MLVYLMCVFISIIGNAFTWLMSWVAIIGIYRKRRINTNQISNQVNLDKSIQESQLALTHETSNQGKYYVASSTTSLELQIEILKQSLQEQLNEIKQNQQKTERRVQELQHCDARRRLEQVVKKST